MDDLISQLHRCTSRGETQSVAKTAQDWINKQQDSHERYLMMRKLFLVSLQLARFLHSQEIQSLLCECTFHQLDDFEFTASLQVCASTKPSLALPIVERHLRQNISNIFTKSLKLDLTEQTKPLEKMWLDGLLAVHDLLLSSTKPGESSKLASIRNIADWTLDTSCECLYQAEKLRADGKTVHLGLVTYTFARLRNLQLSNGKLFLESVCEKLLQKNENSINSWIYESVFTNTSFGLQYTEALFEGFLPFVSNPLELKRFIGSTGSRINSIQHNGIRKILFQKNINSGKLIKILVAYLTQTMNRDDLRKLIEISLICIWTDNSEIATASYLVLAHRTRVLLQLGNSLWKDDEKDYLEPIFMPIICKIDRYMKRPEKEIMNLGILMLEESRKWMGEPENQILKDPEIEKLRDELRDDFLKKETNAEAKESKLCNVQQAKVMIEATALDSDDDLDFAAYQTPKEELLSNQLNQDLQSKHPPPSYLRECIEWLYGDNREKWISAFVGLERFYRIHDHCGLSTSEINLLRKLIFLQDKFSYPGFNELRLKYISELIVLYPEFAFKAADYIFSAEGTMTTRYELLECIHTAAISLATKTKVIEKPKTTKQQQQNLPVWRRIIDERVQAKTRYIGTRLTKEETFAINSTQNRLTPILDYFTFPLLRTNAGGLHLDLLGNDYPLLACCTVTVCSIMQLGPGSMSMPRVCNQLSSVVDSFATRQEPYLCLAALVARTTIAKVLPRDNYIQEYSSVFESWLMWASKLGDDPDSEESIFISYSTIYITG
ncbi:unnamed protein product, partial [Mesorhabditis belari]|uniref:Telomere length regulation protein conserved domain-containing protein n=1 Tax=Mesorhabditis belari TaxID=2138241 RepID=A0AAF3FEW3_9BILA